MIIILFVTSLLYSLVALVWQLTEGESALALLMWISTVALLFAIYDPTRRR